MKYIVVIADVVASRNIADRALTQDHLTRVLSALNDRNPMLIGTLLSALMAILVSLLVRALIQ